MARTPQEQAQLIQFLSQVSKQLDTTQLIQDFIGVLREALGKLNDMKRAVDESTTTSNEAAKKLEQDFTLALADLQSRFEQLKASIRIPQDGKPGLDGAPGKDGKDGLTPTNEQLLALISSLLPEPPKFDPVTGEMVRNELEALQGGERLRMSAIDGLEAVLEDIKALKSRPLGGYSPSGPMLYVDGTKKGRALELKLKAGSNMSLSFNEATGETTLASTGGSGGFSTLSATEAPNGVRTVFTFSSASAQPSYLVVDNVWMKATTAAGTVNWTWNGGTKKATLAVPANDDIWAVV